MVMNNPYQKRLEAEVEIEARDYQRKMKNSITLEQAKDHVRRLRRMNYKDTDVDDPDIMRM